MAVVSVSVPVRSEARLGVACLKYGVEVVKIDTDGGVVYADLTTTPERASVVASEAGATVLDSVEYTEKPGTKFPGTEGEGILLDASFDRERRYGSLMAGPR